MILKDASGRHDFTDDWADWLELDDVIASHEILVAPMGLTISSTQYARAVVLWLEAGTAGVDYVVTVRITTQAGRTDDRSLVVKVRQR